MIEPGEWPVKPPAEQAAARSWLLVAGAFELFEATSDRLEFLLEAGYEFGFGWVGFVPGPQVADQRRRLVGVRASHSIELGRAGGRLGAAGLGPYPRQLPELVLVPAASGRLVEHGMELG
jgi:hypothetical protein